MENQKTNDDLTAPGVDVQLMVRPKWSYIRGMIYEKEYQRLYRDNELGVQMEMFTRRKDGFVNGKTKVYYFIDNDPREFKTENDLMVALRSKRMRHGAVNRKNND